MQDIRREILAYADPIYRCPPKPIEILLQGIPREFKDLDTDTLEQEINMDFEENSPYQKVWYQKCTKGPINHIFRNHQICKASWVQAN